MTKRFLIIFIILILFLLPTKFSFAVNALETTSPINSSTNLTLEDPTIFEVKKEAEGILQKITGEWLKINEWGLGFWSRNLDPYFGKYTDRVGENIKKGWEEEKQEYKEDIFKVLGIAWEKIKNFVLPK